MTPEEIKQKARIIKQAFNDDEGLNLLVHAARCVDELESSALRLAAIEAAGDEEVEKLRLRFQAMSFVAQKLEVFDELAHAFKSRGQEVADLRAKLGEATERIQDLEDGIEAARLGL